MGDKSALSQLCIDVAEDDTGVGCDDIQHADYLTIPLTTVRTSKREMGTQAVTLLLNQIKSDEDVSPRQVQIESDLAVRASTRPIGRT
jgi:DNA-binding LacI/PurR family transcriptional regulator